VANVSKRNYKNFCGYLVDPIHDEPERFQNTAEVSDSYIVTSLVAAVGALTLASLAI